MSDFNIEDQQALKRTQELRGQMMTELHKKGMANLDHQGMDLLLRIADSSDGQILKRKRLSTEDKAADTQRQIAEMTKQLLLGRGKRQSSVAPAAEQSIGTAVPTSVVEGQTAVGTQAFAYDAFMAGDGTPLPKNN